MTHKGYLIDPEERSVTEVEVGDWRTINELIGSEVFTVAPCVGLHGDTIYVDDEGLLKPGLRSFHVLGLGLLYGKGLILGCDNQGESKDPTLPLQFYTDLITWDPQYVTKGMR